MNPTLFETIPEIAERVYLRHHPNVKPRATLVPEPEMSAPAPGTCHFCGCTEDNACRLASGDTCSWWNKGRTICTNPTCINRAMTMSGTRQLQQPAAVHRFGRPGRKGGAR